VLQKQANVLGVLPSITEQVEMTYCEHIPSTLEEKFKLLLNYRLLQYNPVGGLSVDTATSEQSALLH